MFIFDRYYLSSHIPKYWEYKEIPIFLVYTKIIIVVNDMQTIDRDLPLHQRDHICISNQQIVFACKHDSSTQEVTSYRYDIARQKDIWSAIHCLTNIRIQIWNRLTFRLLIVHLCHAIIISFPWSKMCPFVTDHVPYPDRTWSAHD